MQPRIVLLTLPSGEKFKLTCEPYNAPPGKGLQNVLSQNSAADKVFLALESRACVEVVPA